MKEILTLSLGTLFIVFRGRNTRKTRKDFIVFKFLPAEPLSLKTIQIEHNTVHDPNNITLALTKYGN